MFRKTDSKYIRISEQKPRDFTIPKRYIISLLTLLGFCSAYAMRVNVSIAMVAMVNKSMLSLEAEMTSYNECVALHQESEFLERQYPGAKYDWDPQIQGAIIGSFYYGYFLTQAAGGLISEKLGAKWVYGISVLISSILYMLTPTVADWSVPILISSQVLQGIIQGVMVPAMTVIATRWSPVMERSRSLSFVYSGSAIGPVVAMPISGALCGSDIFGGWPATFYLIGLIGCIWFLFWSICAHETPSDHPTIPKEERDLFENCHEDMPRKSSKIPWRKIFTSIPVWAYVITKMGGEFSFVMFVTALPIYIGNVLKFNIEADGTLSALPHLFYIASTWAASYFADKIRESGRMSVTNIRKLFTSIGMIGAGICVLAVTVSGCQRNVIIMLLTLGMVFDGSAVSGVEVIPMDMCPDFAGTVSGFANTIAFGFGASFPLLMGYFTKTGVTMSNWSKVFYLTAGLYIGTAVIFDVFSSAELQSWASGCDSTETIKKNEIPMKEYKTFCKKSETKVPETSNADGCSNCTDISSQR